MQLLPSLLSELQAVCATFPDRRKGRGGNIAAADFGLAAFAMFFMQSASFLAYQRTRWRKATAAPIAGRCSASAESPPTITSATFWTRRTPRCCSPVSNVWRRCWRAADAASLRPAGRKDLDRLGRNGVLLLAETRLPALPDAQARQRQDRELSTQRRQALVRKAQRAAGAVAPRVPGRRSVRLPSRRQDDHGCRRRFHLHLQADFPQDAVRLHGRGRVPPPRGESPPPQYQRDAPLSLDRGGPAARR